MKAPTFLPASRAAAPIAAFGLLTLLAWHEAHAVQPALFSRSIMSTTVSASATANPAPAAPAEVQAALPQARLVGTGSLRFFGLPVYEARLWAAPGFSAARYDSQPFALELEYARKLDGPSIAERSVAEMRRVGDFGDDKARTWLALMMKAFPDVVAKDRLTGVHDGRGGVRFFHNTRPTATTADREYAQLFFGIWLDPRTSAPALRQALIGAGGS
ncbi:MAG TPA: hypothetical protein PLW68_04140 [Casimicrobiaceae bacterium]|nr:hypothetical protein [Casimicrobiaceae bacterium]